jgi:hypothetical protein
MEGTYYQNQGHSFPGEAYRLEGRADRQVASLEEILDQEGTVVGLQQHALSDGTI